MAIYSAPIEDYMFLLHKVFRVEERPLPGFGDLTPDMTRAILEAAADFAEDVLFPLNSSGDAEGAKLIDGIVRTPDGFREAYQRFCADGWNRVAVPEAVGGLGLPPLIGNFIEEMLGSANQAFRMYSGFTTSAISVLSGFGPRWLSDIAIPALATGRWTATMCLTESVCGTDLRLMRSRAVAQADGSFRISGSKIFISGGDHDMGDNVVHLVLAKLPDIDGRYRTDLRAVNFFLVPRRRIDPETGELKGENGVSVGSIEKKMGLKANATCVINFDDAIGWQLAPGSGASGSAPGMAGMFHMMNEARFGTAISAVGQAVPPYQSALDYARTRLAGRAPGARLDPEAPADPLIAQPDVRRLLLESAAFIEGARAAYAWVSLLQSTAHGSGNPLEREQAEDLLGLFTPVFKAFFTDKAFESCNASLQIFGGHGYIADFGIEQYVRDARVAQIYEGANGVQALDFVMRRLRHRNQRAPRALIAQIDAFILDQERHAGMAGLIDGVRRASLSMAAVLDWFEETDKRSAETLGAISYDILNLFGTAILAFLWGRIAAVAFTELADGSDDTLFLRRKILLARTWMDREVPRLAAWLDRIRSGADTIIEAGDENYALM